MELAGLGSLFWLVRGTIRAMAALGKWEFTMAKLQGKTPEERREETRRRWEAKEAEREGLLVNDPGIRAKGRRFIDNYLRGVSR